MWGRTATGKGPSWASLDLMPLPSLSPSLHDTGQSASWWPSPCSQRAISCFLSGLQLRDKVNVPWLMWGKINKTKGGWVRKGGGGSSASWVGRSPGLGEARVKVLRNSSPSVLSSSAKSVGAAQRLWIPSPTYQAQRGFKSSVNVSVCSSVRCPPCNNPVGRRRRKCFHLADEETEAVRSQG